MPAGRPTKLTPTLIKKARQFVADRRTDRMLLPTVEGLALELGIHKDTVYAWADGEAVRAFMEDTARAYKAGELTKAQQDKALADKEILRAMTEEFSDVVSDLKNAQAEKLMQHSLAGKYNASIAKLILSGKHGYVEKQQTDLTTNGKDLPAPILGGAATNTQGGDDE